MREIDVLHLGRPRVICCFELDGVIVDPGPEVSHRQVVEALDEPPRAILLTHIHLDHAGATGRLVELWPDTEVWVHERGAPHLVDPSRLVASATRLYGEADMARLWGEWRAVPQERLRVLQGGETVEGFHVAYTPGHASHHVAYLHEDSGTVFAGDVAGVRVGARPVIAPTPPPDIDLDAWERSLQVVEGWRPERLAITHFGLHEDVEDHLARLRESLARWADVARGGDEETFVAQFGAWLREEAEDPDALEQAAPPQAQWKGLDRYWSKQGDRR